MNKHAMGESTGCGDCEAEKDTYSFFTISAIDHIYHTPNSTSSLTVLRVREDIQCPRTTRESRNSYAVKLKDSSSDLQPFRTGTVNS